MLNPPPFTATDEAFPIIDTLERVDIDAETNDINKVVGFNLRDAQSRPFNLLRSQVLKRMVARKWKMIGITSATPGAGKSFVTANLAASLAQLPDKQVYVLDLDLRRASLGRVFGCTGETGLTQYLMGEPVQLADIGRQIGEQSLGLFPCYPMPVNSAELLVGEPFTRLINAAKALPDDAIVICDLPPAFANDDAMMILQQLDCFLMVVEQGITTKKQLRETFQLLQPSPCIGTVFNRYEGGLGDPYGYSNDSKYGNYYND